MRFIVLLLLLTVPSMVFAENNCRHQNYDSDEQPDFECPSPGEDVMVPRGETPLSIPVGRGDVVEMPWEGALVHRNKLIEIGLRLQAVRRLRWADRLQLRSLHDLENNYQRGVCDAHIEQAVARADAYQDQLFQANSVIKSERVWYKTVWFGFLSGILVSAAVVTLAVYLLSIIVL